MEQSKAVAVTFQGCQSAKRMLKRAAKNAMNMLAIIFLVWSEIKSQFATDFSLRP